MKYTIIFILFAISLSAQVDENGNEYITTTPKLASPYNLAKYANDETVEFFGREGDRPFNDVIVRDAKGKPISIDKNSIKSSPSGKKLTGRSLGECWDVGEDDNLVLSGSYTFSDCGNRNDTNGDTFDVIFEGNEPQIDGVGIEYAGNIITFKDKDWTLTISGDFTLIKKGGTFMDLQITKK